MSEQKTGKDWQMQSSEARTPTNGDAAKRGYCIKHSRALLDIGGEKKCTACRDEQRAREKEKAGA